MLLIIPLLGFFVRPHFSSRICFVTQQVFEQLRDANAPLHCGRPLWKMDDACYQFEVGTNTATYDASSCTMAGVALDHGNCSAMGHLMSTSEVLARCSQFLSDKLKPYLKRITSALVVGGNGVESDYSEYKKSEEEIKLLVEQFKQFFSTHINDFSYFLHGDVSKSLLYLAKNNRKYPDTWFVGINDYKNNFSGQNFNHIQRSNLSTLFKEWHLAKGDQLVTWNELNHQ